MLIAGFLGHVDLGFCVLASGPAQPTSGPGGSSYAHASWRVIEVGEWETKCYIYEPQEPRPASAPVLLFLHGWFHSRPEYYEGWLRHLCRRGWIIIFPQYQGSGEKPDYYTTNAALGIRKAMRYLNDAGGIVPDRDRCATIGHECGAVVGANLAAAAKYFKIPSPKALMSLMPSRGTGLALYDLSGIPAGTLFLVVVGEDDRTNGEDTARQMFYGADSVLTRDKSYVTLLSDTYGTPALIADRFAPLAPVEPFYEHQVDKRRWEFLHAAFHKGPHTRFVRCKGIDAMDYNGTWRLFDAMNQILWDNGDRNLVFDNTEQQRNMGFWSDGKPIRGLLSSDRP